MTPAWDDLGFNVTEVYGPNIVGMSAMLCPAGGIDATELDFRLLCWELYSLSSFSRPDSADADAERKRITDRWGELLGETPFGRLTAEHVAHEVRGIWLNGRLRANTHQLGVSAPADLQRIALLHEAMADLAPDPHRFRRLREIYFCNDVFRLLHKGASVISLGARAPASVCPGRFDVIAEDTQDDEVIEFVHFGRLACTPSSEFASMGARLRALPEHERKLHPTSDPLSLRPGMLLDESAKSLAYLYASPRRLLRSFRRIFLDEFVEFLPREGALEPPSLFGGALHQHLAEALGGRALVVDDDCPVRGKKPDALWCGDQFGIVVEAKARLTPRSDPNCLAPDSLLRAWRLAFEAVDQAGAFLRDAAARRWVEKRVGHLPSRWVLAILVDERGVAERTQFRHATARWKLLAGTGLEGLALLTMECVEAAVRTRTADTFGGEIERAWNQSGADALRQPPEEPQMPSIDEPEYLMRASDLLTQ